MGPRLAHRATRRGEVFVSDTAGYDRAKEVFLAACELPATQRAAMLDRDCGNDPGLRQRVEKLLALDSAATDVGGTSGYEGPSAFHRPLPKRIGPYRITGVIGEGGMGIVYEAEQRRPQRRVALKVIRGMLATAPAMRRFEREVELLGRLRHPQMAQIYDAGVYHEERPAEEIKTQADPKHASDPLAPSPLPTAIPYFALELVNGKPITDYAREKDLCLEDRLSLIIRLCDAVGYAHRKGVIHLDLKPGNILVDYAGHPKILDFGIARATEPEPAELNEGETPRVVMGTVPYMSPEQIRGEPLEIDTRSDIYALGAVCYELLAGRTPHGTEDMPPAQAVNAVLERDPIPINSVANHRVPRDLQRIVSKALQRSREQRYQTTQEFAQDLVWFLAGTPVSVTPHTAWYVMHLFAARHRLIVAAVTIALALLVAMSAWLTSISVAAHRVSEQRDAMRAIVESLLLDPPTVENADTQLGALTMWRDEISPLLGSGDPLPSLLNLAIGRALMLGGQEATAKEVLVPAGNRLLTQLGWNDPRSKAAADIISDCLGRLGETEEAAWWRGVADGSSPTQPPSR